MTTRKTHILLVIISVLFFSYNSYSQKDSKADTVYANITVQQADSLIQANDTNSNFVIIDVRTPAEYQSYYISNAININYYDTGFAVKIDSLDRDNIYLVYCGSGVRSANAMLYMETLKFDEVYNMLGGLSAWMTSGFPVDTFGVSINELNNSIYMEARLYPNPVTDVSVIEISCEKLLDLKIDIFDLYGKLVISSSHWSNEGFKINKDLFNNGVYIYQISSNSVILNIEKFVVLR